MNEGLQKFHDEAKKTSLTKIQDAINVIKADNRIVTKKELIELTGLSSGTFSRPYVKELLQKNKVCQYRGLQLENTETKTQQIKEATIEQLSKKVLSLESKIQDYDLQLEKKRKDFATLKEDYAKLENDHILLRGKYQQMLEYMDALGVDMSKMPLV